MMEETSKITPAKRKRLLRAFGGCPAGYTNEDLERFLDLLYGPHAGVTNLARFNLPEYNKLFDQARQLPDSPERTRIFQRMSQLVTAYAPWKLDAFRYETVLVYPWVLGYKHNVFDQYPWPYLDVDVAGRTGAAK